MLSSSGTRLSCSMQANSQSHNIMHAPGISALLSACMRGFCALRRSTATANLTGQAPSASKAVLHTPEALLHLIPRPAMRCLFSCSLLLFHDIFCALSSSCMFPLRPAVHRMEKI